MKDGLWSADLFRCESLILRTHGVLVVMDQCTRRIVGFGIHRGIVDGEALCRMFRKAVQRQPLPKYLSTDNDRSHEKVVFVKPDVAGLGSTQAAKLTSNTTLFGSGANSELWVHSVQACLNAFPHHLFQGRYLIAGLEGAAFQKLQARIHLLLQLHLWIGGESDSTSQPICRRGCFSPDIAETWVDYFHKER